MKYGIVLITVMVFMMGVAGPVNATAYAVRDLGVLPYGTYSSWGAGISSDGHAVGTYTDISIPSLRHAVVWNPNHTISDCGPAGGAGGGNSVNNSLWVVGSIADSYGKHAAVWLPGTAPVNLSELINHNATGEARSINSEGKVVGYTNIPQARAYLWQNIGGIWTYTKLTQLVSSQITQAYDINDFGWACGYTYDSSTVQQAVVWNASNAVFTVSSYVSGMTSSSKAVSINDLNQVLYTNAGKTYLWNFGQSNTTKIFDYAGGECVNNHGQVVGGDNTGALLYDSGVATRLPSLVAGNKATAKAINDDGYIVGYATGIDGLDHAVIWEPLLPPVVGITNCAASAHVIDAARNHFSFKLWGTVSVIDMDNFTLDDGSGVSIKVVAVGHNLSTGNYASATGLLDNTTNPPTLTSSKAQLQKFSD